ncbi:type II secretion system F family protein [Sneathiella aquimaris]|uniref:type II secretion system F family protein n=1 Tax=Sneathiella aquimaris TaxID=2599305 RepID=UPI00146AB203|nr:type II secretion system F family protein [Sneathiella aquimaris]
MTEVFLSLKAGLPVLLVVGGCLALAGFFLAKGVQNKRRERWASRLNGSVDFGQLVASYQNMLPNTPPYLMAMGGGWRSRLDIKINSFLWQSSQNQDATRLDINSLSLQDHRTGKNNVVIRPVVLGLSMGMVSAAVYILTNTVAGALLSGGQSWFIGLLSFAIAGYFLPAGIGLIRQKLIRQSIEQSAPDVIDLLVLAVEAGMSFDSALKQVKTHIVHYSKHTAEALALLSAELALLPDRNQAFSALVKRTGSDTFRYLAVALSQGEKYGTPIAASLAIVAKDSRKKTFNRLDRKAARLPVILSVPLMLLILPPVVAISAGPGFMNMLRTIGGAG